MKKAAVMSILLAIAIATLVGVASAGTFDNFVSRYSAQINWLRDLGGRRAIPQESSRGMQIDSIGQPASCTESVAGNLCVPYGEGEGETEAGIYIGDATVGDDGIYLIKAPGSSTGDPDPVIALQGEYPWIDFSGGIGGLSFGNEGVIGFYESGQEGNSSLLFGGLGSSFGTGIAPDDFYTILFSGGPIVDKAPGGLLVLGTVIDDAEEPNTLYSGVNLIADDGTDPTQTAASLALTSNVIAREGEGETIGKAEINIYSSSNPTAALANMTLYAEDVNNVTTGEIDLSAGGMIKAYSATGGRLTLGDNGGNVLLEATTAAQGAKIEATHTGDVIIHLGAPPDNN